MIRLLFAACLIGFAGNVCAQEAKSWRQTEGKLTPQDLEYIAKVIGYSAGRAVLDDKGNKIDNRDYSVNKGTIVEGAMIDTGTDLGENPSVQELAVEGARVIGQAAATILEAQKEAGLDHVGARGDPVFREQLKAGRLELADSLDLENGFQAVLVRDQDTGRALVVVRGTEKSRSTMSEFAKDAYSDVKGVIAGRLDIGRNQYSEAKKTLDKWIGANAGNVEVIGHSLGGALGQRAVLDNADKIVSATFFNTPGLEADAVRRISRETGLADALVNDDGTRKVRIYNSREDVVGMAACCYVLGDVVIASGGEADSDPHNGRIFSENVQRVPVDYYGYHKIRGLNTREDSWLGSIAGMIFGAVSEAGRVDTVLRHVKYAEDRVQDRIDYKKKYGDAPLATTAMNALNALEAEHPVEPGVAGDTRSLTLPAEQPKVAAKPPAKPPKQRTVPRSSIAGDTLQLTPSEVPATPGLYGSFTGRFTGRMTGGINVVMEGGQFTLTFKDRTVTGTAKGRVVDYESAKKTTDIFRGRITGRYNPVNGKIEAVMEGNAGPEASLSAWILGSGDINGFSGTWGGGIGFSGRWTTAPGEVKPVTWDEAMCAKHREMWIKSGGTCPPE